MTFIEALKSGLPLRIKGWRFWCKPEIIPGSNEGEASLPTIDGKDAYTLGGHRLLSPNWEVRTRPAELTFTLDCTKTNASDAISKAETGPSWAQWRIMNGRKWKCVFEEIVE